MLYVCIAWRVMIISCHAMSGFFWKKRPLDFFSKVSSTSGYMGATYFQEFGPRFFDISSASGYMGAKYFQEFGSRFLGAYPLTRSIQGKVFLHVATSIIVVSYSIFHNYNPPCENPSDNRNPPPFVNVTLFGSRTCPKIWDQIPENILHPCTH